MKFALVEGQRICEFAAGSEACFPVAQPLQWVKVADATTTADTYVGGAVAPYAPPAALAIDQGDILTLKVAFNQENRIRALEGKPALTAAQFKAAVRALNT
jgi:hypothetical protein